MDSIQALQHEIVEDLRAKRLVLPNIPAVMARIHQALMDDERSFHEVGRLVQLDQVLTSRLIQIANSPLFRRGTRVETPQLALSHLGLKVVRNLVTTLMLKNAYQGQAPRVRRLLNEVWTESCRVSAICHVLGGVTMGLQADKAMLAGIIHNIGILPLVPYLERHPDFLTTTVLHSPGMAQLQGKLGAALLHHWQFDEELYNIPLLISDLQYDSGESTPGYADIVLVAIVHSRLGRQGESFALSDMPAFQKLTVSRLGPSGSLEILEQSRQEIEGLMSLLRG
jgi:HD-like signal output (HDOD) protein